MSNEVHQFIAVLLAVAFMQSVRKPCRRPAGLGIPQAVSVAAGTRSARLGLRSLVWIACGASALDDRRWLVGDKLPGAPLAYPNSEIAIVNVHDRAGHQDLCRHSSSHERGAIDNQNAVCRVRDLEVGKVAGADLCR